ncbi:MAG: hypothetical protein ACI92W_000629 [Paraglaciecola sp.]|jgi:hypothetical protein
MVADRYKELPDEQAQVIFVLSSQLMDLNSSLLKFYPTS